MRGKTLMKIYLNIFGIIYMLIITGCATMNLKPGMRFADVNSEFWVFCNKGNFNGNHILFKGDFEYDSLTQIYSINDSTKRHNGDYAQCEKILYFKNGLLVPDEIIKDLVDKGEKNKRELQAKIDLKKQIMFDFIKNNKLEVTDKFKRLDESNFKIYIDPANQFFYSKNYEFVDSKTVSIEIAKHEREEKEEITRKKELEKLKIEAEIRRKENEIIENKRKKENEIIENKRKKEQQLREQMYKL